MSAILTQTVDVLFCFKEGSALSFRDETYHANAVSRQHDVTHEKKVSVSKIFKKYISAYLKNS